MDGMAMALNFVHRRVQPAEHRVNLGYEYGGADDTTHEDPEHQSMAETSARVLKFFAAGTSITNFTCPKPFSLHNPHLKVSCLVIFRIFQPSTHRVYTHETVFFF